MSRSYIVTPVYEVEFRFGVCTLALLDPKLRPGDRARSNVSSILRQAADPWR